MLEVKDLRIQFDRKGGHFSAVDGLSLSIDPGETLGIVGESGCGKSMTALSILRLLPRGARIAGGSIRFEGREVLEMTEAELRVMRGTGISMIFQDPMTSLNPVLPVGRQISEKLRAHGKMSRGAARAQTIHLLGLVGLARPDESLTRYPHQFSGGMRQRVMIAMALACEPRLIIADEPTTALDVTIQAQVLDLLRRLAKDSGVALMLITHNLGVVAEMADRVNVMYAGRAVELASRAELFDNPRMPYTWGLLGSMPRLDLSRRERLIPIEGMPPDLRDSLQGCRFEPRCPYRRDRCRTEEPPLSQLPSAPETHVGRCWGTQAGGWLIDTDWRQDKGDLSSVEEIRQQFAGTVQ